MDRFGGRLQMPGAMPAELAERLSDCVPEYTAAERKQIEDETERRVTAKLEDAAYWSDSLDGIATTEQVSRLLAEITGARLDRACNDPAGAAMNEILMALAKFQKDTRKALRDEIEDEVEGEMANGGIES